MARAVLALGALIAWTAAYAGLGAATAVVYEHTAVGAIAVCLAGSAQLALAWLGFIQWWLDQEWD